MVELTNEHMRLVNVIVYFIHKKRPFLDKEEMVADGMLGLVKAARDYNEAKGSSFKTYASFRIKGSILDGIRLSQRLTGYSRSAGRVAQLLDLDSFVGGGDDEDTSRFTELLSDDGAANHRDEQVILKNEILEYANDLTRRQQQIAKAALLTDMSQSDMARRYGISDSQITQLMRTCGIRLRQFMGLAA